MANTFSTMQIRNNNYMEREPFTKAICKAFEKKGLVPATEEEAQFSYRLIFSNKSDFVTFTAPEYESDMKRLSEDAEFIAKQIKSHCVAISVWDSDMLELRLFGSTSKQKDYVIVGCPPWGDDDEFPTPKGEQKQWRPLLTEGSTWKQLLELFNSDNTFIEDCLHDIAPLLGMDSDIIALDYDSIKSDMPNAVDLHFKKKADSGKKVLSLNAAFKQVYGEALEPLGFVKIKGRHPYFVRLIGDEIIHVVTYRNESPEPDYKTFSVLGGVATVYRQRITLNESPSANINWLKCNLHFYEKLTQFDENPKYSFNDLYTFSYTEETIIESVKHSLEITKEIMLPILDEAVDINSCIEYFHKFERYLSINYLDDDFGNSNYDNFYNEGLLLIKANKYREYMEKRIQESLTIAKHNAKTGKNGETQENYEKHLKRVEEDKHRRVEHYHQIYYDYEWHDNVSAELERRKAANVEILRSYGLDV